MVIDQSRPMFATLPSKWTGDGFGAVVMRTDCPFWSHRAPALKCLRPQRLLSGTPLATWSSPEVSRIPPTR